MNLHFDPNQQFQHDAINSIVGIFEGQSLNQGDFSFSIATENSLFKDGGVCNKLEISEEHGNGYQEKSGRKFEYALHSSLFCNSYESLFAIRSCIIECDYKRL